MSSPALVVFGGVSSQERGAVFQVPAPNEKPPTRQSAQEEPGSQTQRQRERGRETETVVTHDFH